MPVNQPESEGVANSKLFDEVNPQINNSSDEHIGSTFHEDQISLETSKHQTTKTNIVDKVSTEHDSNGTNKNIRNLDQISLEMTKHQTTKTNIVNTVSTEHDVIDADKYVKSFEYKNQNIDSDKMKTEGMVALDKSSNSSTSPLSELVPVNRKIEELDKDLSLSKPHNTAVQTTQSQNPSTSPNIESVPVMHFKIEEKSEDSSLLPHHNTTIQIPQTNLHTSHTQAPSNNVTSHTDPTSSHPVSDLLPRIPNPQSSLESSDPLDESMPLETTLPSVSQIGHLIPDSAIASEHTTHFNHSEANVQQTVTKPNPNLISSKQAHPPQSIVNKDIPTSREGVDPIHSKHEATPSPPSSIIPYKIQHKKVKTPIKKFHDDPLFEQFHHHDLPSIHPLVQHNSQLITWKQLPSQSTPLVTNSLNESIMNQKIQAWFNRIALYEMIKVWTELKHAIDEAFHKKEFIQRTKLRKDLSNYEKEMIELGWAPEVKVTPPDWMEKVVEDGRGIQMDLEVLYLKYDREERWDEMDQVGEWLEKIQNEMMKCKEIQRQYALNSRTLIRGVEEMELNWKGDYLQSVALDEEVYQEKEKGPIKQIDQKNTSAKSTSGGIPLKGSESLKVDEELIDGKSLLSTLENLLQDDRDGSKTKPGDDPVTTTKTLDINTKDAGSTTNTKTFGISIEKNNESKTLNDRNDVDRTSVNHKNSKPIEMPKINQEVKKTTKFDENKENKSVKDPIEEVFKQISTNELRRKDQEPTVEKEKNQTNVQPDDNNDNNLVVEEKKKTKKLNRNSSKEEISNKKKVKKSKKGDMVE